MEKRNKHLNQREENGMNRPHITASPLTGTIFCGNVPNNGRTWGANKKDVTIEALVAVAEHVLHFKNITGEDVIIPKPDGKSEYKIIVERID